MKRRSPLLTAALLVPCLIAAGCADFANTRNMAAVGTILGTGAGIAIGAATGDIGTGVMLGAAAGGLGGAMAGNAWDKYSRKRAGKNLLQEVDQDMLGGKDTIEGLGEGHYEIVKESRWVDTSTTKRVWVEEKVVDGKFAEAHFERRLVPSGYWVEEEKKVWVEGESPGLP